MKVKKRAAATAAIAHLGSMYVVAELVHAIGGQEWHRLEKHLDGLDDRADVALDACRTAGDGEFADWLENTAMRGTDMVGVVTARFAREPVR
ncbi:hypothetical protein ACWCQP_46505 [Streptomyces chartreusis]|uniref:Uncharacterized protein n=1 Tax=Streptomyces sp. F11 TaxID=319318 RepID=V9QFM2_9ACTN|nr:hypothetical protein [Streptomyces sp. F11]AHC28149.1 hypothetical protein pFP12.6 [Streptomyces sp. F11]